MASDVFDYEEWARNNFDLPAVVLEWIESHPRVFVPLVVNGEIEYNLAYGPHFWVHLFIASLDPNNASCLEWINCNIPDHGPGKVIRFKNRRRINRDVVNRIRPDDKLLHQSNPTVLESKL